MQATDKTIPLDVVDPGGSMYVSEGRIHPREVRGRLDTLRRIAVFALLGMFYVFPWLQWDGRQSVRCDLLARRFYVFGLNFWPQDFFLLAMLLMIAAFALFFFTALAGRLWCGYACPQTVWTETFLWIEHWAEGDRGKRIKLDAAPWSADKLRRRGGKHLLWVLFALWTGFTFVGFFTPIRDLFARAPLVAPGWQWGGWESFWVFFYALATWGNAGFLREQVCKYMCPYARFQSAMFDRNTLLIAYDPMRGEPRGPRRKSALGSVLERARGLLPVQLAYEYVLRAANHPTAADNAAAARATTSIVDPNAKAPPLPAFAADDLGDCIDCTICVQVCPTGIDIRNGLQYECIACGACIDACDGVMDRMGYPRGLIRYSTQNAIDGKPTRVVRPRILLYAALLLVLAVAWGWGVANRSLLIAEVLRDRNALYRETAAGIENTYTLKIANKDMRAHAFQIDVRAPAGVVLVAGNARVRADAEQVLALPLVLRAPHATQGRHPVTFVVASDDGSTVREVESSFFGAMP